MLTLTIHYLQIHNQKYHYNIVKYRSRDTSNKKKKNWNPKMLSYGTIKVFFFEEWEPTHEYTFPRFSLSIPFNYVANILTVT